MRFANMTNIDWQLGDVTTSAKGIRSAPLMDGKNNSLHFQLTTPDKPLYAPFGASAYNDPQAIRKSICFRVHEDLESKLCDVDAYVGSYIAKNSARLFKGKQMTYKPLLQTKEDYPALLRAKINTSGTRACRFWTPQFARCDAPQDLRECGLVPRVCFRSLWIMGSECGISVDVTDLLCDTADEVCPFLQDQSFLA